MNTSVSMKWFFFLLVPVAVAAASHLQAGRCTPGCDCHTDLRVTSCSGASLRQLPVRVPPGTELLDLSDNAVTIVPSRSFATNRKLRVLLLRNNSIGEVEDAGFAALVVLHTLDLSWNRLATLSAGFSVGLAALRELLLAHNRLTQLDGSSFLHLDGLRRLNLSCNAIHSVAPRTFATMSFLRQLHLQDNRLTALRGGSFSMLRSLEVLNVAGNHINRTEVGAFEPLTSLALLDLAANQLSGVSFKSFLSLHTYSTHVLLVDNPWNCDCDLQRVFRKLRSVQRLFLDDYYNLTCVEPAVLRGYRLTEVDDELCVAETVTVLIISVTVAITVLATMLMGERKRKKKKRGRHWTQQGQLSDESDY